MLGWHINMWNLIGSIAFTVSACLGYCDRHICAYQSDLTVIWASAVFLFSSLLQWYESMEKYPVVMDKAELMDAMEA